MKIIVELRESIMSSISQIIDLLRNGDDDVRPVCGDALFNLWKQGEILYFFFSFGIPDDVCS